MARIAIYTRKSHFTSAGESIENQIQMCKEYVNCHFAGTNEFYVYQDEGFSGKNTDRPEFQKMLADLRSGNFDTLICYRLDRISRSVSDFSATLDDLIAHNVNFVSTSENFDTSTPIGRAMIYIASVFAELERETIAERVRDNKYKLYRTGRWQGGQPPVGFTVRKVLDLDEDGHKRSYYRLETDEKTAPHAKMLFEEMGRLGSLSRLENHLLKNHIPTAQGKEYSLSVLRQIISNPVYAINDQAMYDYLLKAGCDLANSREEYDGAHGLMGYGKTRTVNAKKGVRARAGMNQWIIAVSPHQGLIPGEQWAAIQTKIAVNAEKYPRTGTGHSSLLSGIIRCGQCGAPMVVKNNTVFADGTTGFTYKCNRKHRSSGELCSVANSSGGKLDAMVVTLLKELFMDGGDINSYLEEMFRKMRISRADLEKDIKALQVKIMANEERMMNLTLKLGDSRDTSMDQMIYAALEKLKLEAAEMTARLKSLQQTENAQQMDSCNLETVQDEITRFCDTFDQKDFESQRQSLQNIVRQVTWYGDDFEVELFGGKQLQKGCRSKHSQNFECNRGIGDAVC